MRFTTGYPKSSISTEYDNIDSNLNKLIDDIISITNWAHDNQLGINLDKTKATAFGPQKLLDNFFESDICIQLPNHNISIPFVKSVKNLGIIFDHKLKWDDHIIKISNKIRSTLYRLRYFKNYVDLETRKQLVMSLIMPHFDYWSSILGNLKNEHLKSLNVLQNSTIRYIFNLGHYDHVSNFRKSLNWLEIGDRFKFNSTCFLFKILLFQYPDFLFSKLKYRIPPRELRPKFKELEVPTHHCKPYSSSFLVSTGLYWNTLPPSIRLSSSLNTFKNNLSKHINSSPHQSLSIVSHL